MTLSRNLLILSMKALNPEMSFHLSPMVAFGGGANVGYKYFFTENFIIEGSSDLGCIYMSTSVFACPYAAGGTFGLTGNIGVGHAF